MKRHEDLDKAMCHELEKLNKKYADGAEMSQQDVERADTLYHALKCAETYYAMMSHDEDDDDEEGHSYRGGRGYSYARYRSPRTGRFISRDDGWSGRYPGEYGYSGRYPMEYIDPMWDRR